MGLSFHYSGRIANPEFLPELIEEIEDIAKVFNWKYFVFERQFPDNTVGNPNYNQHLYGICFTPTNCETIDICFLSNGRMSSAEHLQFWGKTNEQPERDYLYMLSVKTQYAGSDVHLFVIQLFRYLNVKYLADFKLSDDGRYWETNDESVLKKNFVRYTELIEGFASAIQNQPIEMDENMENYFIRLIRQIHEQKDQDD